jgi:hypothetical protein
LVIDEKKINIFYEVAFEEMIKEGSAIYIVDTTDYICMEIDTADDLESAAEVLYKNTLIN